MNDSDHKVLLQHREYSSSSDPYLKRDMMWGKQKEKKPTVFLALENRRGQKKRVSNHFSCFPPWSPHPERDEVCEMCQREEQREIFLFMTLGGS